MSSHRPETVSGPELHDLSKRFRMLLNASLQHDRAAYEEHTAAQWLADTFREVDNLSFGTVPRSSLEALSQRVLNKLGSGHHVVSADAGPDASAAGRVREAALAVVAERVPDRPITAQDLDDVRWSAEQWVTVAEKFAELDVMKRLADSLGVSDDALAKDLRFTRLLGDVHIRSEDLKSPQGQREMNGSRDDFVRLSGKLQQVIDYLDSVKNDVEQPSLGLPNWSESFSQQLANAICIDDLRTLADDIVLIGVQRYEFVTNGADMLTAVRSTAPETGTAEARAVQRLSNFSLGYIDKVVDERTETWSSVQLIKRAGPVLRIGARSQDDTYYRWDEREMHVFARERPRWWWPRWMQLRRLLIRPDACR